jgi:ubiquinone/menaquinone biosynthesis C-methylase UbiE
MGTIADNGAIFERALRIEQRLERELSAPPFALQNALIHARTVLDVGCNCGVWTVAQARKHLYNEFIGIEEDAHLVQIARWHAQQRKTPNAQFACHPLRDIETIGFPLGCFGYIQARFLARGLLDLDYAALATSLFRLCKPGGVIAWTEFELPITSSPAWQSLCSLLCRALDEIGQRYAPPTEIERLMAELRARQGIAAPERRHLCITPRLAYWLARAGFEQVQSIAHAIDISAYAPAHGEFVELAEAFFAQVGPLLMTTSLIQEAKLGKLFETARRELQDEHFCGLISGLTAWGKKPAMMNITTQNR